MNTEDQAVVKPIWCRLKSLVSGLSGLILNRSLLITVGLGQTLSLLICGTAVTSGLLQTENVLMPTAQSFLNYALLCIVFTTSHAFRIARNNDCCTVKKQHVLLYIIVSVVDVEANYFVVKAYQYTTVTSVQLLDCLSIPTVLLLSYVILRVRYRWPHYVGVALCITGIGSLILADVLVEHNHQQHEAANKVLGDLLCLAGAVLYGISNVCQEYLVCRFGSLQYLAAVGLFGSIASGIQLAVLEREEVASLDLRSASVVIPFVGFALCLFLLYALMPHVIAKIGAMAVNLNLLSSDFYSLLLGLFFFRYKFHFLYFVAFGVIIIGIVIYTVHLPKAVAESDVADSKDLSCSRQPVTLVSVSYQNGGNVHERADVEAQNAPHETDNSCTDQLMSRQDVVSPAADI